MGWGWRTLVAQAAGVRLRLALLCKALVLAWRDEVGSAREVGVLELQDRAHVSVSLGLRVLLHACADASTGVVETRGKGAGVHAGVQSTSVETHGAGATGRVVHARQVDVETLELVGGLAWVGYRAMGCSRSSLARRTGYLTSRARLALDYASAGSSTDLVARVAGRRQVVARHVVHGIFSGRVQLFEGKWVLRITRNISDTAHVRVEKRVVAESRRSSLKVGKLGAEVGLAGLVNHWERVSWREVRESETWDES